MYNYTKPRCPVAAVYNSPGPCYGLPPLVGRQNHDPRSVHRRGPAYAFGHRDIRWETGCSPGPCYAFRSDVLATGVADSPRYSLYGRLKEPEPFNGPGPGAYKLEKAGNGDGRRRPAAYSIAGRIADKVPDTTPGRCDSLIFCKYIEFR